MSRAAFTLLGVVALLSACAKPLKMARSADQAPARVVVVRTERFALRASIYVDLYTPFERQPFAALTTLLSPDGDHPSATGHQLISDVLLRAISSPSRTR